jgi:uncharacterized protein (DUF58 family)
LLTRQGALATAVSVGLVVAGRLFAIFELFVVGAGGAALVVGAVVVTGLTRLRLDVSRQLHPPRIHAGEPATVTLVVTNGGRRRTPVIQLRDAVGPGRTASVVLSPLAPGEHVTATYSLPSERRGRIAVGPLEVRISDPFGLTALSVPAAPVVELIVWPAVEAVTAPSSAPGRDEVGTPAELAQSGTEFYALRPYADGDDLRRVHWRASAKRDDLVVRQDERSGRGQATIVLDTRIGAYGGDAFERAVSAVASIVVAAARRGLVLRLLTTAGHDSALVPGSPPGPGSVDAILDHLAVVALREVGHLPTVVPTTDGARGERDGKVVVVTGDGRPGEPSAARASTTGPASATRVVFTSSRANVSGDSRSVVVVDESTSFASAWNRAMAASAPTSVL